MSKLPIHNDNVSSTLGLDYQDWLHDLHERYQHCQLVAAVGINAAQLKFYWTVGHDIVQMHIEDRWGEGILKRLSHDLTIQLDRKGFSVTSLGYMKRFYLLYPDAVDILPPTEGKIAKEYILPPTGGEMQEPLFCIPWSHHKAIIDAVKGDAKKGMFYVRKTMQNQWGRAMLLNMLTTDLYETQSQTITNFDLTLPKPDADLAKDLFKGTYDLGFTKIREHYNEAQLKENLVDNISKFLIELGRGFSFVGREYRICGAGKEKYIDLLFYIIPLHRYCVIEVKITEFDFPDAGQLAGYMGMVDDILNTEGDNPSIGLLICQSKNDVFAQYALSRINTPISIADYILSNQLPTTAEIKNALQTSNQ